MEAVENPTERTNERRDRVVGAVVMIGIGLLFLLAQVVDLGALVLPALAGAFPVAGVATRSIGWFIPSGIMAGLSLGIYMMNALEPTLGDGTAGVFLLSFALGWASITFMTWLFTRGTVRWPLIPGGILAFIGGALLAGERGEPLVGLLFTIFNVTWPVVLIVMGVAMLLKLRKGQA